MKKYSIYSAFAIILLPAAIGISVVNASPTCKNFITSNFITQPIKNRVSKQTQAAWDSWRLTHPNWKPRASSSRARYKMQVIEAESKIEFACQFTTEPVSLSSEVLNLPPDLITFEPITTSINLPDIVPTEIAELSSPIIFQNNIVGPLTVITNTPEPPSIFLLGSSMLLSCLFLRKRKAL